jgi:hypothetical protein
MTSRTVWWQPPNVFALLVLVLLAVNYFSPFADLDYTWQIRTGEQIVATGNLRPHDTFTYTIAGEHVPDFEWLYEVVLWWLWTNFGYGGLKLLKTVLVATPLILLGLRLRREGVRWHGIALAVFTAVFILTPAWNLRPLYCTTIGLLLVSGWLHDHCTGRKPLSWWLPVVMLVWSNAHPGVITGQGLLAGAIAWEWLNRRIQLNKPLGADALWRLTLVGGLGLAATFVAPDPIERMLYPFRPELAHPIQRIFGEMRPLWAFWEQAPITTMAIFAVAALVTMTIVLRFRAYRLWEIALLAGLALLANYAYRSVQDWLLVMLAFGVPHLVILLRRAAAIDRRRLWVRLLLRLDGTCKRLLNSRLFRFQPLWPIEGVLALAFVSLLSSFGRHMPLRDSGEWPVAAVNHIERLGLSGRFFGPPDYGSYVTWRLGDRAKSYTDTRGFFFPPHLLEDSHFIPQLGPDWRKRLDRVLDEYATDYFLLETTGPRGELWRRLQGQNIGRPIYCDERAVLLSARQVRDGVNQLDARPLAAR